jgi:hypothetical protein
MQSVHYQDFSGKQKVSVYYSRINYKFVIQNIVAFLDGYSGD